MIAYVDSSVLLRYVLGEPDALPELNSFDVAVSSTLLHLEVSRTLDRLWLRHEISDDELAEKTSRAGELLQSFVTLELDQNIIDLAGQSFSQPIATLDALHLASAMLYRQEQPSHEPPIIIATHDKQLARAADAMHFDVVGA